MTVQIRAMRLRILFLAALLLQISCSVAQSGTSTPPSNEITIDATAKGTPFPHFWEQMFGSGRAALSLRESYRKDLQTVKKVTDFRYVRFHAIFHDELGLFHLDAAGQPVYNFPT
jgi:xylan 1,4-beta-xylosidase